MKWNCFTLDLVTFVKQSLHWILFYVILILQQWCFIMRIYEWCGWFAELVRDENTLEDINFIEFLGFDSKLSLHSYLLWCSNNENACLTNRNSVGAHSWCECHSQDNCRMSGSYCLFMLIIRSRSFSTSLTFTMNIQQRSTRLQRKYWYNIRLQLVIWTKWFLISVWFFVNLIKCFVLCASYNTAIHTRHASETMSWLGIKAGEKKIVLL